MLNADSLPLKTLKHGSRRDYFDRPTAMSERSEMHVTTLNKKGPAHETHACDESEIILVISGETEMTIEGKDYKGTVGDLYFINSAVQNEVRNASDKPCSYFVLKWY